MVIWLERGADLHVAQLMPLLLTVSCFSKIQIGVTFLVLAHLGSPGQRAVKRLFVCFVSLAQVHRQIGACECCLAANLSAVLCVALYIPNFQELTELIKVKVLRPTRHKIIHFGDDFHSQALGVVLKSRRNKTRQAKWPELALISKRNAKHKPIPT